MDMMTEMRLWKERRAAIAAGLPWEETHVYIHDGYLCSEETGRRLMAEGVMKHCRQCSSPRQVIYHDRRS